MRAASSAHWSIPAGVAARRTFPFKLVVGGAIVLLTIGYLLYTTTTTLAVYYVTVSELQAQGASDGRMVRVSGDIVPGSIVRDGTTLRFTMVDADGSLPVVYQW